MKYEWRTIVMVVWTGVASGMLMRGVSPPGESRRASRPPRALAEAPPPAAEQWTAALERTVRTADPFARPTETGAIAPAPVMPVSVYSPVGLRMRLSAIAGPPWRAIVATDGPAAGTLSLQVGDTVRGLRVAKISADSIVLRGAAKSNRYGVGDSWAP